MIEYSVAARFLTSLLVVMLVVGCAQNSVERVKVESIRDLSGLWNDTDSRLVSEEMINDAMSHPWIEKYHAHHHSNPAVIVGKVRNLSHEHINVNTFIADMERALINSNRVESVASATERKEIRQERQDQDIHSSEDTRKAMDREHGADFMLTGSINSIIDTDGSKQIRYYQVDLTMISLSDNRKVWLGQKKIKKLLRRAKLRP